MLVGCHPFEELLLGLHNCLGSLCVATITKQNTNYSCRPVSEDNLAVNHLIYLEQLSLFGVKILIKVF